MNKWGFLVLGAIGSPVILFFGEIALLAIGVLSVAIVGSTFFDELKGLDDE